MELNVLPQNETPWFADGLKFTCTQCGSCCTGGPGYVWISAIEIGRLAEHLRITPQEVIRQYCRRVDGKYSFRENRTEHGDYDCVFLTTEKVVGADGVAHTKRGCSIYPVRPLQCRTWPFWPENLRSRQNWDRSAKRCHGMNAGARDFSREKIESLRDAKDWPHDPPTSAGKHV